MMIKGRKSLIKLIACAVLGGAIVFFGFNLFLKEEEPKSGPSLGVSSSPQHKEDTPLGKVVSESLEGSHGTYGIVIKNLKTGESFSYNPNKVFEPGSLYKLWIMGLAYQQIQKGELSEDEVLSEDVTQLNQDFNIDPDSADLTSGTITLTVSQALNQMITISHNYAALLLTKRLGLSSVSAYLKDQGFKESTVGTNGGSPTSTPSDIAFFLEKLYRGKLANKQYTQEMIGLLKDQQLNEKLPKYLPDSVVVAHKTGEIDMDSHDAGIVYTPSGDYIIVVFSESNSPSGAQDRIALISKAVYEYFTGGR